MSKLMPSVELLVKKEKAVLNIGFFSFIIFEVIKFSYEFFFIFKIEFYILLSTRTL